MIKPFSAQVRLGLLTLAPILLMLGLAYFLPPDGHPRAEWMQFLGRFHLVTIHFPIALVLVLPLLELAGFSYRFDYLRLSAGFVLGLAALSATVAVVLGWFLARSGGYSGPLVIQHMWGGVSVAAVCWLCWMLRERAGFLYAAALVLCVGLVSWTGYRGGQLSQGENHLIQFMPAGVRDVLGIPAGGPILPMAAPNSYYAVRLEPIFQANCISCHGPDKQKGNFRMDSYGGVMKGGKSGLAVKAADVKGSDLVRRLTLPPDNDDFMPKSDPKRPLPEEQIKLIELWIAAGASATTTPDGFKDAPQAAASQVRPVEVTFPEFDVAAVTKLRAEEESVLEQLRKQFPDILVYESRASANLMLNASLLGSKFGDSDLAAFAPLSSHITIADLSRTAITDRSASAIAAMRQLRVLRLANTRVSDSTVQSLEVLDQLESLNVFGTRITAAALPAIAKLPKLAHCYMGQTSIPAGAKVPQGLAGKVEF